jgi:hypothetical protein
MALKDSPLGRIEQIQLLLNEGLIGMDTARELLDMPAGTAPPACERCHGMGELAPLIFGAPYPCSKCGGSGRP